MTYAGTNGDTTKQMEEVLHYSQRRSSVMRGHRALLRRMEVSLAEDVRQLGAVDEALCICVGIVHAREAYMWGDESERASHEIKLRMR